jgi:hypothetical protein
MITLTLPGGRVIEVEARTPAELMDLGGNIGKLGSNAKWFNAAKAVAAVRSIDGLIRPMPTHKKHVESLIAKFSDADMALIYPVAALLPDNLPAVAVEAKMLTPLERLWLDEAAGELNECPGWYGPAFVAATARKIDGEAVEFPRSADELRSRVERLGFVGMEAAALVVAAELKGRDAEAKATETAAKN